MQRLSEAIIVAALILGLFFYFAQRKEHSVRVVGYASGEYTSDIIKWNITYGVTESDILVGFQSLNRNLVRVKDFLESHGLDAQEIEVRPAWHYANWNNTGRIVNYTFEQNVTITVRDTSRFDEIQDFAIDLTKIIQAGINIRNSSIEYFISALPSVKQEIISEATRDARERAEQVAKTTNTRVGRLINGRVGVFQITEPLSVEVQSLGIHSTHTRKKQISVTFTGEFSLKTARLRGLRSG
jgi:hypothetical protein